MQYPKVESLFDIDDQWLVGSDLLVKPVTAPNVVETVVKFPSDDIWYDAETLVKVCDSGAPASFTELTVPSDIETIPVFQRGGSIITRKLRLRRSSHLMIKDPYTLYVALNDGKVASGSLYMDDEISFDHEKKEEYVIASFTADFSKSYGIIDNQVKAGAGWQGHLDSMTTERRIERIIVMGVSGSPSSVDIGGETLGFSFDTNANILVIRKPDVSTVNSWQIKITY